jgi:molybdopterin synthase catalytic subunit
MESDVVVVDEALSVDACIARVRHVGAGAVVVMLGLVRDHTRVNGDVVAVQRLQYEAYVSMAEKVIADLCAQLATELPGVRAAVAHRVGDLVPGDLAVVVAVSSPHRKEAFVGCERLIDRLKHDAPIWKREHGDNGVVWVGMGP